MRRTFSIAFVSVALVAGCGRDVTEQRRPELTVFAAASSIDLLESLAPTFTLAELRISFGPSSDLARQIADGAPADVYLSAHPDWLAWLGRADRLHDEPVVVARNRIVCIARRGSDLAATDVSDLEALAARLGEGARIAIGAEAVPVGDYARQALRAAGVEDRLAPRLVGLIDARAVLRAVARGDAEAGFVYRTDARDAGVESLFVLPEEHHEPIVYLAAAIADAAEEAADGASGDALATAFVAHLRSPAARRVLEDLGFEPPREDE